MSYFQISNGPGIDAAPLGDASGEILQSLLAAGIAAPAAQRIATALRSVYAPQASLGEAGLAALNNSPAPQRLGGNLGVGGDLQANNLRVLNNAEIGRQIDATAAAFRSLQVLGGARIGPGVANFDAPLVANRPVLARQGGQFAGENVFNGRVALNGQVVWGGQACQPANAVLIKSLAAGGNNKLRVGTQEVRVLREYGSGPGGALQFDYDPTPATVIAAVTANTATEAINNYTLSNASVNCVTDIQTISKSVLESVSSATTSINNYTLSNASVNCVTQVQTTAITVITAVGFNADSCAVTSETTTVYVVTSVDSGSFSAATYSQPPETPTVITEITGNSTSVTAVSGVSSGLFQAATYVSPPTSVALIKALTLSGSTASVAGLTGNIRITAGA